ncbi:MAG: PAS domain S-box protein [Desulfuromonadales bacterium]
MPDLPESSHQPKTVDIYVVRLTAAVIAINLFVFALVGFSLRHSYQMYQERAAVTSQNLALSLRNNINDTFDKTELALFVIAEEVARQRNTNGIDRQNLNAYLANVYARLPYLEGLRVADAHGTVAYSSDISGPLTTISDRKYFTSLRDNPAAGLIISRPIISRALNKWVIACARRLSQPDGSFAGIVFAVFSLEQFTRTFSSLDIGKQGIVSLFDIEMSVYARYPELSGPGSSVGRDLKNSTVHRMIQEGRHSATFINTSPLDSIRRTLSYHKISDKPLYVIVGVATGEYLAEWRKEAVLLSAMAALFFLITSISSWLMYNSRKSRLSDLQALKNSESRYRTLFDSAGDGILIVDMNGFIRGANEIFCSRLGYREEELLGKDPESFVAPENAEYVPERGSRLKEQGHAIFETVLVSRDGVRIPTEISARVIDFAGQPVVMSLARDITERKTAEERLLREKEFSVAILNSLPGAFYIIDTSEKFLRWNENFEKITGYSSDEFCRISPLDLFGGTDRDLVRERIHDVFVTGAAEVEAELVTTSGKRIPYLFTGQTIRIEGSFCLIGMGIDITERKLIEETRNKALLFIETLLASSPTGILVYEGDSGYCVLANQAVADMTGGTIATLRSQNFRNISSWRATGYYQLAESVLADGVTRRTENEFGTSFGKSVALDALFSRFDVDGRPHLLLIVMDISERIHLAEENRQIAAQMLHVQKLESLGVLAGGIAHDFNNILTAVLGNADLALMRLPFESPARENLIQIEKAAGRATELARQMLAYSGKGHFVIETLNFNEIVEEMAHMLEVSISKKALLLLNFTPDLPTVEADATQLRQVLMNLVINASEAIGFNSGVIAITTGTMECDKAYFSDNWTDDHLPEGLYVYLEVADTGCGMDRELIPKIFDPFFTTKFTGRGLGMSAVLGIIRGHKGAIKVSSEKGKGTSFKLLLPVSLHPVVHAGKIEATDGIWKGTGIILLVDDEESIRVMGEEMLHELGFDTLTASDGLDALEVFNQNKDQIRCVILDLTMPRLDGEQTFREIRRLKPDVRVLISSGFNEQEVTSKFVGKGLSGFIQKPYKIMEVSNKLREILEAVTSPCCN